MGAFLPNYSGFPLPKEKQNNVEPIHVFESGWVIMGLSRVARICSSRLYHFQAYNITAQSRLANV